MRLSEFSGICMKVFVGVSIFGIVVGIAIFALETAAKLAK